MTSGMNIDNAKPQIAKQNKTETMTLLVEGMSCASCVGRVERALSAVPGVRSASVNLATEAASIVYNKGALSASQLISALGQAGYFAKEPESSAPVDNRARKKSEAQNLAHKVTIAALLALPVFIIEMGGHLVPSFRDLIYQTFGQKTIWLIQFALTSIVLFGPGRQFYSKGIPALLKGAPDMNSLAALGTGAAYIYSLIATFTPELIPQDLRTVYYEVAVMVIVLILTGRWLEALAKGRTGAAIEKLLSLQVQKVRILQNGTPIEVDIQALKKGDLVIVRPGERIATDGEVVEGSSYVDESMITGEPVPVMKTVHDSLTGGTINGQGGLSFRATHVGADTTLAKIIRMVEEAQGAKLPIQAMVDKVTLWFVPAVMGFAGFSFLIWLIFGPSPAFSHAFLVGVSVLIIACPCAMGLATPTSIMVGTGRAAQMGVLFRKSDALQTLSDVDIIAFDKTGTLTWGKPDLTDLILAPGYDHDTVLGLIASLEARSEHPIAQAIVQNAQSKGIDFHSVDNFNPITGYGVRGSVNGSDVLIGAQRLMLRENIDIRSMIDIETGLAQKGRSTFYVAINGKLSAVIAVADAIKPTSKQAIDALRARGLRVVMMTGDKKETAQAIAHEAGINEVIAEVLPEGKRNAIDELRQHAKVAFVGDGINDTPALAAADIGIAIGTGTDIAIESADVVLMAGDLKGVVSALALSQSVIRNIRQNLGWAFGYNVILIPVAAGVLYPFFGILLSPILAAGAMAFSSVFVLMNALRLRWFSAPIS